MQRMEEIKRELVESGLIPRVLHDFNPRLEIIPLYGDKRIRLGDEVNPGEVQNPPTSSQNYYDVRDLEIQQIFRDPKLIALIMTDPDAPGGEYLHWLSMSYLSTHYDIGLPRIDLVAYESPRVGARMLVLTLFKMHEFQPIAPPNSRENFNTTTFAHNNALGWPVAASFFRIRYIEKEDKAQENGHTESSTCNGVLSDRKWQENGSINNLTVKNLTLN